MDFSIATDIDTDLLHWDDDNDDKQEKGSSSGHSTRSDAKEESAGNVYLYSLGGSNSSMTESDLQRLPQHLPEPNNLLEPIFPPNYFVSGGLPWDPSQAVTNPQATKIPVSNQMITQQNIVTNKNSSQVAEEWGASQISQQIALHQQVHNNIPNHNAQDLAAAVARAMLPEQVSLQDSQARTITDASVSVNTGSSSSSLPSSSTDGQSKASSSISPNPNNRTQTSAQNPQETPPFYLFDAPCELRANFLQAQRQNDMTNFQDSNSFHYGMAVNGFHPQVNAQVNPIMPASLGAAVLPNGKHVELIDGRHKHTRKSSQRNEREQQRAQKITELIDKLRNTMEEGGWRVEMKSKYQILSHSTDYLKHLIDITKEKERNLKKTKTELAIRNQKLEEYSASQDGRSDPESVTSSLTTGSSSESKFRGSRSSMDDSSTNVAVASSVTGKEAVKRKGPPQDSSEEAQEPQKKCQRTSEKNDDGSNQYSSHIGSGRDGKNISIEKMSSSLLDITDSNRGSSDEQGSKGTGSSDGQGSKETKTSFDLSLLAQKKSVTKTESSISSTAAVVSGEGSGTDDHRDTNIIFTRDRKRKCQEKTSLDKDFELSYQEVFLGSNVPQLIATPAGRIVACNDFFFRVTGLTQKEVKRITIFSMVQVDKLSTLFDVVADSLRKSNSFESSSKNDSSTSSSNDANSDINEDQNEGLEFQTMTLPCVPFPQELTTLGKLQEKRLFMNVTFMYDSNPSKRYIHCALTDKPGVRGKIGTITPQLLSMLFSPHCPTKPSLQK